ncbi:MAG: ABC transporter ATP-binding protein [Actinomycetota bacterium]
MNGPAIRVRGLTKRYGEVEAVRGIDLTVEEGEVFALLGPNGAGKTTTVEILEGYRPPTAGSVSVLGFDPSRRLRAFRQRIGIVLQETGIEPFLTVSEALELYRGYYPNPRPVQEVIEVVGLQDKKDARVNRLSGGQRRRLDVAIGLAGDPDLLFLDEPTTGFDPAARRNAWEMVRNLAGLGKTVFLTTHYMDEAENLAGRVAVIFEGRLVATGAPQALIDAAHTHSTVSFVKPPGVQLPPAFASDAVRENGTVQIRTDELMRTLHEITGWAMQLGLDLDEFKVSRPTLEDVFLALTGKRAEES